MSADKWDFLFAICSEPDNLTHRLVYADYLEEQDQPERAEFIRLACENFTRDSCLRTRQCAPKLDGVPLVDERLVCPNCRKWFEYKRRGHRHDRLFMACRSFWKDESGLGGVRFERDEYEKDVPMYQCEWNNGFVEEVTCNGTWQDFLQDCRVIFRHHPVRKFSIDGVVPRDMGNDFDCWFSDQFIDDNESLGQPADGSWVPWEVAKHFPMADSIETGYGGRYGIPRFTRHYWTFDNTEDSAALWLSNQLCRYGFNRAWEDRIRERSGTTEGIRGIDQRTR